VAGPVDGEAPPVSRTAVAQPAQRQRVAVDVGESGARRTCTVASCGRRCRAWSVSRGARLDLVDAGGVLAATQDEHDGVVRGEHEKAGGFVLR